MSFLRKVSGVSEDPTDEKMYQELTNYLIEIQKRITEALNELKTEKRIGFKTSDVLSNMGSMSHEDWYKYFFS